MIDIFIEISYYIFIYKIIICDLKTPALYINEVEGKCRGCQLFLLIHGIIKQTLWKQIIVV